MIFTSQTRVYKKAFLQVRAKMPLEGERSRTTSTHYSFYYSDEVGMLYERKKLKVVNAAVESVFRETGFAPTLQAPGIQEPGSDGIDTAMKAALGLIHHAAVIWHESETIDSVSYAFPYQDTPWRAIVFARNLLRVIYEIEATAPYMTQPVFLFAEFDHRTAAGADLRFVAQGDEYDHMKVLIRVMGQDSVSFQFIRSDLFTINRFALEDRLPPLNFPGTRPYDIFVGGLFLPPLPRTTASGERTQTRWMDLRSFAIEQLKPNPRMPRLERHRCAYLSGERSLSSKLPHPVRTWFFFFFP